MISLRTLCIMAALGVYSPPQARPAPAPQWHVKTTPANAIRPTRITVRDWKENDAPKCLPAGMLGGMMVNQKDSLDLVMRDGQVFRAKLKKGCASMEFYSGLYVRPSQDGRLCEDRDIIYSRGGGDCMIGKFKSLRPPGKK